MVLFLKLYSLCDFKTDDAARDVNVIEPLSRSAAQELQLAAILASMATTELPFPSEPSCSGSTRVHGACLQGDLTVSPPFGDWDGAWVHCSDVDFVEFLVWFVGGWYSHAFVSFFSLSTDRH